MGIMAVRNGRLVGLSRRFILLRSLKWIVLAFSILALISLTSVENGILGRELHLFRNLELEEFVLLGFVFLMLSGAIIWAALQHHFFRIDLNHNTFSISKGVLLRQRWSFPTDKITALRLARDFQHLILGLYSLDIVTPGQAETESETRFARIEGLNLRSAVAIQRAIRQSAQPPEREVAGATLAEIPEEELAERPSYSESVAYM